MAFDDALAVVDASAGLRPGLRHIANSAATLASPRAHYDLVRPGIAVYGVSPGGELGPPSSYGLTAAMTLRARLALVKRVPAGQGVSYGHDYVHRGGDDPGPGAARLRRRHPARGGEPWSGARRRAGSGRSRAGSAWTSSCWTSATTRRQAGDEVVLFGDAARGQPTAEDWAAAAGTIGYEIVTRLGPRIARVHRGGQA